MTGNRLSRDPIKLCDLSPAREARYRKLPDDNNFYAAIRNTAILAISCTVVRNVSGLNVSLQTLKEDCLNVAYIGIVNMH